MSHIPLSFYHLYICFNSFILLPNFSFQLIMDSSHTRAAQKVSSHSAAQWSSTNRESVRYNVPPQQAFRSPSLVSHKPPTKENTKPIEFKFHTQQRALKRAMFNYSVATKLYFIEQQKKLEERVQKMIEEEEIKLLRKEMIPRAQLMPFFDRPFYPQRSSRPLTVPREPCFHNLSSKNAGAAEWMIFQQCQAMKPIK